MGRTSYVCRRVDDCLQMKAVMNERLDRKDPGKGRAVPLYAWIQCAKDW